MKTNILVSIYFHLAVFKMGGLKLIWKQFSTQICWGLVQQVLVSDISCSFEAKQALACNIFY